VIVHRAAMLAASGAMLAACAALPPPEAGQSVLSGRLAVRVDGQPPQSFSADFELRGDARHGSLRLAGPLGTTAADARWSPAETRLLTAQGSQIFASLDELSKAALGEPIPLAALFDWLRGRPWSDAPSAAVTDGATGFEQLGWRIDLSRWAEGWIEARRDAPPRVTVRARMEPPA
jgi:outer membrane lipoprotein LolB